MYVSWCRLLFLQELYVIVDSNADTVNYARSSTGCILQALFIVKTTAGLGVVFRVV